MTALSKETKDILEKRFKKEMKPGKWVKISGKLDQLRKHLIKVLKDERGGRF